MNDYGPTCLVQDGFKKYPTRETAIAFSDFTVKFIELLRHSNAHIYTDLYTFMLIIHKAMGVQRESLFLQFSERQTSPKNVDVVNG